MIWLNRWIERTKQSGRAVASFDSIRNDLNSVMKESRKNKYKIEDLEAAVAKAIDDIDTLKRAIGIL